MIYITKLNNTKIIVNAELIESIEKIPDTVIKMTTGRKIVVKEDPEEIIRLVIEYKQRLFMNRTK